MNDGSQWDASVSDLRISGKYKTLHNIILAQNETFIIYNERIGRHLGSLRFTISGLLFDH